MIETVTILLVTIIELTYRGERDFLFTSQPLLNFSGVP
jgi:hypothetical protein